MTFTTSITSISFNTINNPTAKPAGYGDYTALTTSVYKGSTYNLTVKANTAGNYTVHTFAWIDWNQDGDFSDTGEAYDLGSAINVTNGITTLSPISILIPSTALTGNTRMRLAAKYSTNPILCETSFDGEVEDYSINVLATITGSKRVNISAGGLSNALTTTEKSTTTNLTITGTLDARDFVTLRDLMPKLAVVDISATSIVSYTGTAGTIGTSSYLYPANEIPKYAFYNYTTGTDNKTLISIVLPNTITSIGDNAFYFCFGLISANIPTSVNAIGSYAFYACWDLTSINIPLSVTTIGNGALTNIFGPINVDVNNTKYSSQNGILFDKNKTILIQCTTSQSGSYSVPSTVTNIEDESFEYCNNITSINIPWTVSKIGYYAFDGCSGYITVEANNQYYSSLDGVLFDKMQTILIQCPTSKTDTYSIPLLVNTIGMFAFENVGITSLTIPISVTSINSGAFYNCNVLASIYAYAATPIDLSTKSYVFEGVNKSTCTLYVPIGSKVLYQAAVQWNDFTNIDEKTITTVSMHSNKSISLYPNPTTDAFQISGIEGMITLRLLDINGRLLLTKQLTDNESISVSTLPKGLYIVKVITEKGTLEQKIVKK